MATAWQVAPLAPLPAAFYRAALRTPDPEGDLPRLVLVLAWTYDPIVVATAEPKREYVIDLTVPEEDDWIQKLSSAS